MKLFVFPKMKSTEVQAAEKLRCFYGIILRNFRAFYAFFADVMAHLDFFVI